MDDKKFSLTTKKVLRIQRRVTYRVNWHFYTYNHDPIGFEGQPAMIQGSGGF